LLFFISSQAKAEEIKDKFRIAIGGYTIPQYDSAVSLTDAELGAGASINPQNTLGLTFDETVLRLDGRYRFSKTNSLTFSWYSIAADGSKIIDEEFDWVDDNNDPITIPVGASVQSQLDYDIYKIGYLWSFYHTNKVELSLGAGLHITKLSFGINVSDSDQGPLETKDVKSTVPLPVVSFRLGYHITPKFFWYYKSEAFYLAVQDWEGTYTDVTLGMEYRFWEHVSLGTGLGSNSLRISENTSEYKFAYDNRLTGILFYVAGYFY